MSRKKNMLLVTAGILAGVTMTGPAAHAAAEYLKALPSAQSFYLDGAQVALEAYAINGRNYIQLVELGELLGVTVTYRASDNSVHISTGQAQADGTVQLPADGSRYIPQAGDVIRCNDGTDYTITDVSRYDKSLFASGPLGELPAPTCDWSSFPEVELPEPEARHFNLEAGDYLFIRNLYETRRMQYTLQTWWGTIQTPARTVS